MQSLAALGQLNQVPIDMTLEGLRGYGQAQQADQIGLQELMRKQTFEQSADPMRLQDMQTQNRRGLQDLAIGAQDLRKRTRDNREGDFTSDARMQAEYKGFLAKASEADISMAANKFQEMTFSRDPKIKAQGIAGMQMTKDFVLQKQREDNARSIAAMNNRTQIELEDKRIAAGKYDKVQKVTVGFQTEMSRAQGAAKKLAVVQQYLALAASDPELANIQGTLQELERRLEPQARAELAASQSKPGTIDLSGVTDGRVPTQPNLPITPGGPKLGTKENPIKLD